MKNKIREPKAVLYDGISVEWMLRMAELYDTYRELGIMEVSATGCTSVS